ncbi:hypothetical protein CcaverHIS002_0301160 [Cutaneotrichosporon cavernicola]|uniref:Uncharacterized protein n=1 Tax=Cutaneotrichosporon cavernicola TaxID=279322 RepID=A0AA48I688_9TREE|nr:uncharacterized protein CcaverHIS019_0301120 [Cutaneotrichosporon cavernicola]BEI82248.1 hypothetical protein CcaverHIS002_0301160 [Cutaneotrichosporon cavernicola]BEI90042.1 hypothetical protein CcaverHIS019_0301120 [Cutaneotrichosporon cavernicola]BEI97816.1 hypothetical protein CcaverHIS631_0301150 [Cutaneotrichosporon cavernicola]BEJ05594.1 hypothetical protein CcaverHIS641_0301160 [Cutaneotrichosporon cavernicola]
MAILETTADQMTQPTSPPRRGSLAAMKDKFTGGGSHDAGQHVEGEAHEARHGSFSGMRDKLTRHSSRGEGDHATHSHPHHVAQPSSPTGRRSSLAVMHDKLTFYNEPVKGAPPAKVNIREATADEMINPPGQQGRRSSFARMGEMFSGRNDERRKSQDRRSSGDDKRRMSGDDKRRMSGGDKHAPGAGGIAEGSALDTTEDDEHVDSGVTPGTYAGQVGRRLSASLEAGVGNMGRRLSASLDKAMHPSRDVNHQGPRPGAMNAAYDAA